MLVNDWICIVEKNHALGIENQVKIVNVIFEQKVKICESCKTYLHVMSY